MCINCPCDIIIYGGARGGGKTDSSLGEFAIHALECAELAVGLFLRKNLTDLRQAIKRAKQIYGPLGAEWFEVTKSFKFSNGAEITFAYLERESDAEKYQGQAFTRIYIEELTQFKTSEPVDLLFGCMRSSGGVRGQIRMTCNPGGVGHSWVKERYVDPGPFRVVRHEFTNPYDGQKTTLTQVFIPARLKDNPLLMRSDPTYVARLHMVGSEALVRAWLMGDWDVLQGAFFDCWRSDKHVIQPFDIPDYWTKFRSLDWGSAAPFSLGWWAVVSDPYIALNSHGGKVVLPRGCLVRYREWYGRKGPNVGIKKTPKDISDGYFDRENNRPVLGIKQREQGERIDYGVADPAINSSDSGPTIRERFAENDIDWRLADNKRVSVGGKNAGPMGGWSEMYGRLAGQNDNPMIVCFNTCRDSIRTIPALPHDPNRAEDVDTNAEDHAADEWRYACMSRPWIGTRMDEVESEIEPDSYGADDSIEGAGWMIS